MLSLQGSDKGKCVFIFFLFQIVQNLKYIYFFHCFYLQHQQTCETDGKARHILPSYFHSTVVYFRLKQILYEDAVAVSVSRGLPVDERQSAAELEAVLQHQHNLQEKLAEDMLNLARNLKNNTLAAQNIIKQDNQVTGQGRQTE